MNTIKYSQYNLLTKELDLLKEENPFIRGIQYLFKTNTLSFDVLVPNDLYQRAETLCDDITKLHKGNKSYTQNDLVNHVFDHYIEQVRNNDAHIAIIYNRLELRNQQFSSTNNHPLIPTKSRTTVSTKIPRENVYRAEILLKDFSVFFPKHSYKVENLLEIVYLDFLHEYQNGRRSNVMKEILDTHFYN